MKESGCQVKETEWGNSNGQMVQIMKVNGKTIKVVVGES